MRIGTKCTFVFVYKLPYVVMGRLRNYLHVGLGDLLVEHSTGAMEDTGVKVVKKPRRDSVKGRIKEKRSIEGYQTEVMTKSTWNSVQKSQHVLKDHEGKKKNNDVSHLMVPLHRDYIPCDH